MKLIAQALAEIKPVYYPGKERLVSLDILKRFRGEDLIRQNPIDKDLDGGLDKRELRSYQRYLKRRQRKGLENHQKTGEGRSYILNQT